MKNIFASLKNIIDTYQNYITSMNFELQKHNGMTMTFTLNLYLNVSNKILVLITLLDNLFKCFIRESIKLTVGVWPYSTLSRLSG